MCSHYLKTINPEAAAEGDDVAVKPVDMVGGKRPGSAWFANQALGGGFTHVAISVPTLVAAALVQEGLLEGRHGSG